MEPRAQRQAIRDHLNSARAALDRGDRANARAAVLAALALDPEYLAARALLERIDAMPDEAVDAQTRPAPLKPVPEPPPLVSAAGWARFEQRTRARRVEKRAAAAREAIARGRLAQAREILAEIREIDAAHPELISLAMELDAAEHQPVRRRGLLVPLALAACALGVLVVGASYGRHVPAPRTADGDSQVATVQPIPEAAPEPLHQTLPAPSQAPEPASTAGVLEPPAPDARPERASAATPPPSVEAAANAPRETPPVQRADRDTEVVNPPRPIVWPPVTSSSEPQVSAPVLTASASVSNAATPPLPPAVTPEATAGGEVPLATTELRSPAPLRPVVEDRGRSASAVATPVRDDELVRQVLQQYRLAYETLDAKSAQRVWPAVDGIALQRAFDGLESQRLNFDDCSVQVRGASGSAVCRGSARYVPKVGSREPRVEPRVWRFGMRKTGDTWEIVTARAER